MSPQPGPPQLYPGPRLPWGDGNDSGYSGSPEVDDGGITIRCQRDSLCLCGPKEYMSSCQLHGMKQKPPNHTDTITPFQQASTLQPNVFPRILKVSKLRPARSANAKVTPAGYPWEISSIASSARKYFRRKIYHAEPISRASITVKQSETLLNETTSAEDNYIHDHTPTSISHNNHMANEPNTSGHGPSDPGSNIQDTTKIGVLEWVDATKDACSFPSSTPSAIPSAGISDTSSSAAPVQALSPRESPVSSSRSRVLEFWSILQDCDHDYNAYESSQADESIEWFTDDKHSLRTSTTGSGSNGSLNSSATSNSTPIGLFSRNAPSINKRSLEREGDEDEFPNRRPNRGQGVYVPDAYQDSNHPGQMSCPMLESHDCQGTNTTISELMRSLTNRHRIVICKECCTRLPIPDEEKRPVTILQKHASHGCERYCIGISCASSADDSTTLHRRTERCPSWATLTKEARWTFIWRLVNPEANPPEPNFLPGPAFEHSQMRRPCKQQARARGNEMSAQLMRDKERRISTLENDLTTAKTENMQTQQRCNEKIVNLENIIESLLERLHENGIGLPGSLRKRVQNECPEVMAAILAKESQIVPTLPTSIFTPNHGYYLGSGVPSTWGNMPCPPSAMPKKPATWGAVSQQMVGPNPGYYFPESSEKAPTTSVTYPTNACIQNWDTMSLDPSAMHAQVGRHSSSETPETVQPYE